jgi:hypothetical protein
VEIRRANPPDNWFPGQGFIRNLINYLLPSRLLSIERAGRAAQGATFLKVTGEAKVLPGRFVVLATTNFAVFQPW